MISLQFFFNYRTITASRIIHEKLVNSVFKSTFRFVVLPIQFSGVDLVCRWLDETPTARIIARCTQDIRVVDTTVPLSLLWIIDIALSSLIHLGAIVLFTPIFILPGFFVVIMGVVLGNWYLKAQLSIKREMRYVICICFLFF